MNPIATRLKGVAWYHWLFVSIIFIYLIFIALSYFYLPGKLKRVTETDVSKMIGREISVETIQFNPFILSLTVNKFSIADKPENPLVTWDQLMADFGFWKSIFSWEIAFDELRLDKPRFNIIKQKNGFNFSDIIERVSTSDSGQGSMPEVSDESRSIAIEIFNTSINKGALRYADISGSIPATSNLDDISIVIKEIYLATGDEHLNPFSINANGPNGGKLHLAGKYRIDPLHVEANIKADGIDLSTFSGFLENILPVKLSKGMLSLNTNVLVKNDEQFLFKTDNGKLSIRDLILDDFKLKDTRTGNPFFSFKAFKVDDIKAEIDKQFVSIASVSLLNPEIHVSVSEQKEINLAGLMKSKESEPAQNPPDKEREETSKWTFEIGKTNLSDGIVLFSDKSVKPAYKITLNNMVFSLDRVGSNIKDAAPFSFKTDIDKYAPFTIKGSLEPLDKQPGFSFTSKLEGLEMSHLSPYSGVYIGNNLKSGKLELNLDYTLHDRKIKGKNNIIAKNLYLGETVPGEPVINAPVGLGLALLRDLSGVIDLDVGISGDLDDPGFSVAGIVVKALVNIIAKAVASPFKLLGALIPGGGDDLGEITFDPGTFLLNQDSKESMEKLISALNKRPQLILSIKGNAAGQEDIDALKLASLKQLIAQERGINISEVENERMGQEVWMISANQKALEKINNEMGLISVTERMEKLKPINPETPLNSGNQENMEAKNAELEQKVYEQVFKDMLKGQEVNEDELIALADQRALSIKQHLVDDLKLSHERVSVIKTSVSDLSGRVIKLELGVM